MRIELFHFDAFATQPFAGNAAAVCPLNVALDDTTMSKVAAENNLSATAFLVPGGDSYELRWFTPRCEIRLCGHATMAAAAAVLNHLQPELESVRFETRASGILLVRREDDLFLMDFPRLVASRSSKPAEALLGALGTKTLPSAILEGNDSYIAVYENEETIRSIRPDYAQLERLHPFVAAVTAPGTNVDFVSRYFAPSYGVAEDPVTGSVHCALAPYWSERLGKSHLHARQLSERGGELWCEVAGDRVILKGAAVLTMRGSLII